MIPKKKHVIIKPFKTDRIGKGILYAHLEQDSFKGEIKFISEVGCEGIAIGDIVCYNPYAPKVLDSDGLILCKATDIYFVLEGGKPKCIQNRIALRLDETEERTKSGLVVIRDSKPELVSSTIEMAGADVEELQVGDKVYFMRGVAVMIDEMLYIRETDVIGKYVEAGES